VLNGNVIEYVLGGSPASMSEDITKGDMVLKVDDNAISDPTVLKEVLVNGTPGSSVTLTISMKSVSESTSIKRVVLTRIASDALSDRTHMYELFAKLKVHPDSDARLFDTV
jgi:C-terminal processing protease CtpA/Prc